MNCEFVRNLISDVLLDKSHVRKCRRLDFDARTFCEAVRVGLVLLEGLLAMISTN